MSSTIGPVCFLLPNDAPSLRWIPIGEEDQIPVGLCGPPPPRVVWRTVLDCCVVGFCNLDAVEALQHNTEFAIANANISNRMDCDVFIFFLGHTKNLELFYFVKDNFRRREVAFVQTTIA
mmetsp:Transcript_5589/g.8572  ORF Transcript_5589/g.8572 Transcript_5589/m.8572 type:complete len:120 (+) Transcript_5589:1555-1914(+)